MALCIVESPNKISTIKKLLGQVGDTMNDDMIKNALIIASVGHIRNVSNNTGADYIVNGIKNDYTIEYENMKNKYDVIKNIKKEAKSAKIIYIMTDLDREGEAIGYNITQVIGKHKYKRICFNEITYSALLSAFQNPSIINMDIVKAQQSRQILDKVLGFKLTQFLWNLIPYDASSITSAGRVQSVILYMICERIKKINEANDIEEWNGYSNFEIKNINQPLNNCLIYKKDKDNKYEKLVLTTEKEIKNFWSSYNRSYYISDYSSTKEYVNPPKPYITATLLKDAFNRYKMPIEMITNIAQDLYEGGYITYIRTDHAILSNEFKVLNKEYIINTYGEEYFNELSMQKQVIKPKVKAKSKKDDKKENTAQEAHEAIRPTNINKNASNIKDSKLTAHHLKVYDLIWKTTVASMMKAAIYDVFTICINCNDDLYLSKAQLKGLNFIGFKIIYKSQNTDTEQSDIKSSETKSDTFNIDELKSIIQKIMDDKENDYIIAKQILLKHNRNTNTAHYTKTGLIDDIKKYGIGRPSTYVSMINLLFDRKYCIEQTVIGEEKEFINYIWTDKTNTITVDAIKKPLYKREHSIMITDKGNKINDILQKYFKDIINIDFTSIMEKQLDNITEGKIDYIDYVKSICDSFLPKYKLILDDYQQNNPELLVKNQKSDITAASKQNGDVSSCIILKKMSGDNVVSIGGHEHILTIDKFKNPTIKYIDNDKIKYINISGYLEYSKRELKELTKKEIIMLKSLPIKAKPHITIYNGKYGLYVKDTDKDKQYTLPLKYLGDIIKVNYDIFT